MPDSAKRPLDGDRLGQRDDGRLGGAVGAATCRRVLGVDRTDEQEHAARLPQRRVERPGDVERPGEVDRQRAVPVLRIDVEDRVERGDRGAVDHGIDARRATTPPRRRRRHRTRRRWSSARRGSSPGLTSQPSTKPALVERTAWRRRPRCRSPRRSRRRAGVGAPRLPLPGHPPPANDIRIGSSRGSADPYTRQPMTITAVTAMRCVVPLGAAAPPRRRRRDRARDYVVVEVTTSDGVVGRAIGNGRGRRST